MRSSTGIAAAYPPPPPRAAIAATTILVDPPPRSSFSSFSSFASATERALPHGTVAIEMESEYHVDVTVPPQLAHRIFRYDALVEGEHAAGVRREHPLPRRPDAQAVHRRERAYGVHRRDGGRGR